MENEVEATRVSSAGAPSLRRNVLAVPFTAVVHAVAVGFPPVEVDTPSPLRVSAVVALMVGA